MAESARFQRTRGILRLLALWVARAYQDEHRQSTKEPLITLGSAPLEDPIFRAAMFEQLGSNELEVPVTTDIAGKKDAHSVRLDREAVDAIKKTNLHRKVASAIFFESNGGMSQSKAEASLPEIRAAVGSPDLMLSDVEAVLEGLVGTCYYLNWDRNRYRFGLTPNLNQILVTRRGAVQPKEIAERIRKETQEPLNKGSKALDRRFFPERSNDVPNRPVLTLVPLGLDYPAGERATEQLMESIVRDCGNSGRTYKSAILFAVPDSGVPFTRRRAMYWHGKLLRTTPTPGSRWTNRRNGCSRRISVERKAMRKRRSGAVTAICIYSGRTTSCGRLTWGKLRPVWPVVWWSSTSTS